MIITLNMIVKNESKIITRLFDSVLPLIDNYCICDTGSTDSTQEIIKNYFDTKGIQGKIISEPFKNFEYNRNFALEQCIRMGDYILLLDADMILQIGPEFNKSILTKDFYCLLQGTDTNFYKNTRIVKNKPGIKYKGVTHEYLDVSGAETIQKELLFILDCGDGGSKHDKFERDIRLLTEGVQNEPKNVRYHFYLANSYFCINDYQNAIEWYKKRIALKDWEQEVYYSYYRVGLCYKELQDFPNALFYWNEGYDYMPTRVECIYEILKYCREKSKYKQFMIYYPTCKSIVDKTTEKEKSEFLFLHNDIYTYKLDFEYSIISCYIGVKEIGSYLTRMFNNCDEEWLIDNVLRNMKFNKEVWKYKMDIDLSFTLDIGGKIYHSSTPSIISAPNGGYYINVRVVNYYISQNGSYLGCDDHIITENKFLHLDNSFDIIEEKIIPHTHNKSQRYVGVEDVRLCINDGKLIFTGTNFHNGKLGMCFGHYTTTDLQPQQIYPDFANEETEKNWVYTTITSQMIYKWFPLTICNHINDQLTRIKELKMPKIFRRVRGSTNGAKYNDEIWFVTHIVSYEQPRHYYHLMAVFNQDMTKLLRYSHPFKFTNTECIEYCLGLVVEQNRVLISYSTMDRTSHIGIYGKEYVESKLVNI